MSFFSGLDAEKYDRQYSDRVLFQRIISLFKPFALRLISISFLVFAVGGIWVFIPLIMSKGLDWFGKRVSYPLIGVVAGVLLLVGISRWLLNWIQRSMLVKVVADILQDLMQRTFQAAVAHDLSFYDEFSSGKILSRITTDTRDFGNFINLVTDLVSEIVTAVILGIILVGTNHRLSFIIFSLIPGVFILSSLYRRLARKVTRQGMRAIAEVNASIKETVSGISIAKNFRQEASIFEEFNHANRMSYRLNVRRGLTMASVYPLINAIGGIMIGVLVYVGGMQVIQGVVTAGVWYLFLLSLDGFLHPVLDLSSFITQVQTGLAAAERIFSLVDAKPAVHQLAGQVPMNIKGGIELRNLSFSYATGEPVLRNFNLCIRPGENLAIVGHTGAGKTSIGRLIARFYEFQSGELLIDGQDIRTFDLEAYRRRLGIVSQTPFLFSDTVIENIRYACPEATDEEINHLARGIGEGEWLDALPNGLYTEVGERGALLSMGQRQLVSLMRVLLQKPSIFILDEATASIDPFTEWQIQSALKLILSQTTSIVIAHRLSTVKSADRIIVMQDGRILEEGTHDQLMENSSHYADLYNVYFRHQSMAYVESARTLLQSKTRQ